MNDEKKEKWGFRNTQSLEEQRKAPLNVRGYMSYGIMSCGGEIDPQTGRPIGEPDFATWIFDKPGPERREVVIVDPQLLTWVEEIRESLRSTIHYCERFQNHLPAKEAEFFNRLKEIIPDPKEPT